jgi:hypothetical protein
MKASKWYVPGVVLLSATCLVYCGKPLLQPSHSGVTEAQAQADLSVRLVKTQEVRAHINAVRDAIRPVESILHDLGKAIDLKVDQKPGTSVATILDRLERVLREAAKGFVATHGDGSWELDRPSPFADLPSRSGCSGSRIRVSGQKIQDGEEITIAFSGCTRPSDYETLAVIDVRANGDREISLSASTFENIHHETINLDPCTLKVDGAGNTDFRCNPMTFVSNEQTINIDHLEFRTDAQGTHASAHARLAHAERGLLGTAFLSLEPNRPVDVRVCTKGESCGG